MKRVLCSTIHGTDVEREVIGGEGFDPRRKTCDLESVVALRCDDGRLYQVQGWLVDVTILGRPSKFYLMTHEDAATDRDALPVWKGEDPRAWLCSTCDTLKRQEAEHFGSLREAVLERDGYRCRVCDAPRRGKREIIVHHRVQLIVNETAQQQKAST